MNYADVIGQIFTTTIASVNISLVIILLAVGYICKHAIKNLSNDVIPIILGVISIIFLVVVNYPFNVQEKLFPIIIEAIATTLIATIAHDKVKDIIGGLMNKAAEDIEADITDDKEE